MKTLKVILPFLILPLIVTCHKKINPAQVNEQTQQIQVIQVKDPDTGMVKNNNIFALELYQKIRSETKNSFFSPFSISAALAMTYAGARGESEKQIGKVMHFESDQSHFHPAYKALLSYISSLNKKDSIEISVANSMWAQKGFPFLVSYLNLVVSNYDAELSNFDFSGDEETSRAVINKWVEEKTKGKIKELIKEGMLSNAARLVLVNAIYYYGNWDRAFNETETRKLDFTTGADSKVQAGFMHSQNYFRYFEGENFKAAEIPYKGKTLSMLVLLPSDNNSLPELEKRLNNVSYHDWLKKMTEQKIELYLPKFKTTSEFELSDVLKNMGMPHPFGPDADLSGMAGGKGLSIDKVVHKAFVEVNEKGTEAAAATAVIIRKNGAVLPVFKADHPFIFIIKENTYNNILFMGRINDPTE